MSDDWQLPFSKDWLSAHVSQEGTLAWRGVEDQHIASTMQLVDSFAEQDVLEQMLEGSKPPLPSVPVGQHYLLSTPFRYRPAHGSRFRKPGSLGIWYGAQDVKTAAAEVAYWRWRFIMDSAGLTLKTLVSNHTFFQASVTGSCVQLMRQPWSDHRHVWTHHSDYSAPQQLAEAAAEAEVSWISYESVRDPGGTCCAVLTPFGLTMPARERQEKWVCIANHDRVRMACGDAELTWDF